MECTLIQVLLDITEEEEFTLYAAAHDQAAIKMFWFHFLGALYVIYLCHTAFGPDIRSSGKTTLFFILDSTIFGLNTEHIPSSLLK